MIKKLIIACSILALSASLCAFGGPGDTDGDAGVGLQTPLNKNLDLRGEYDFVDTQSIDGVSEHNKLSPTNGQVKLGLVFKFD